MQFKFITTFLDICLVLPPPSFSLNITELTYKLTNDILSIKTQNIYLKRGSNSPEVKSFFFFSENQCFLTIHPLSGRLVQTERCWYKCVNDAHYLKRNSVAYESFNFLFAVKNRMQLITLRFLKFYFRIFFRKKKWSFYKYSLK